MAMNLRLPHPLSYRLRLLVDWQLQLQVDEMISGHDNVLTCPPRSELLYHFGPMLQIVGEIRFHWCHVDGDHDVVVADVVQVRRRAQSQCNIF